MSMRASNPHPVLSLFSQMRHLSLWNFLEWAEQATCILSHILQRHLSLKTPLAG